MPEYSFDRALQQYFSRNSGAEAQFLRLLAALPPEALSILIRNGKVRSGRLDDIAQYVKPVGDTFSFENKTPGLGVYNDIVDWLFGGSGRYTRGTDFGYQSREGGITLSNEQQSFLSSLLGGLGNQDLNRLIRGNQIGANDLVRIFRSGVSGGWISGDDIGRFADLLDSIGVDPSRYANILRRAGRDGGSNPDPEDPPDTGSPDSPWLPDDRDDYAPPPWDEDIWGALKDEILDALQNPGWPKKLLEAARNTQRSSFAVNLRDATQSAQERLAERGITDSGMAERSFRDISTTNQEGLATALQGIDMENARAALQRIANAMNTALGMRGLDLEAFSTQMRSWLEAAGINLAKELGLSELEIKRFIAENNYLFALLPWLKDLLFPTGGVDTNDDGTQEDDPPYVPDRPDEGVDTPQNFNVSVPPPESPAGGGIASSLFSGLPFPGSARQQSPLSSGAMSLFTPSPSEGLTPPDGGMGRGGSGYSNVFRQRQGIRKVPSVPRPRSRRRLAGPGGFGFAPGMSVWDLFGR